MYCNRLLSKHLSAILLRSDLPNEFLLNNAKQACTVSGSVFVDQNHSLFQRIRPPERCNHSNRALSIGAMNDKDSSNQELASDGVWSRRNHLNKNYFRENHQGAKEKNVEYSRAIKDLNDLQSNTQAIALAKYKRPQDILPLFSKQLLIAGINVEDLDKLNAIHISGTKGKGSTCAFVESILRSAGLRTGFYNSPHLIKVLERIKLDGQPIDDLKFAVYFRQVYDRLVVGTKKHNITMPSYFSFLTILAFHIFLEEKVDCAVIEVGIGGEYDPTNIIQHPVACGISTIHYDHMNILGDTIESIAWSKAGIAKEGVPVFTVDQAHETALEVIKSHAKRKNCLFQLCPPFRADEGIELGIKGSAQHANASLAWQLGKHFLKTTRPSELLKLLHDLETPLKDGPETSLLELPPVFRNALTSCSWPGRCQILEYPKVDFFLDGAHTKESMQNCVDWFLKASGQTGLVSKILMVNIIGERNRYEILRPLNEVNKIFETVIFSTNRTIPIQDTPNSETFAKFQGDKSIENVDANALTWNHLLEESNQVSLEIKKLATIYESLHSICERSVKHPDRKYQVLVTGSLHFVGATLETLTLLQDKLS